MISTLRSDEIIKKINVSSAKIHLNLMENILKTDNLRLASFKLKDMENLTDNIVVVATSPEVTRRNWKELKSGKGLCMSLTSLLD